MLAAKFGHAQVVSAILEKNSSLEVFNAMDPDGNTALMLALCSKKADVVAAILEKNNFLEVFNVVKEKDFFAKIDMATQQLIQLFRALTKMRLHAVKLGEPYKSNILPLTDELKRLTGAFFSSNTDKPDIITKFNSTYQELLPHMTGHRAIWKPILLNIMIAATGIGLLVILGAYFTTGRLGLFSQTARQSLTNDIYKSASPVIGCG